MSKYPWHDKDAIIQIIKEATRDTERLSATIAEVLTAKGNEEVKTFAAAAALMGPALTLLSTMSPLEVKVAKILTNYVCAARDLDQPVPEERIPESVLDEVFPERKK